MRYSVLLLVLLSQQRCCCDGSSSQIGYREVGQNQRKPCVFKAFDLCPYYNRIVNPSNNSCCSHVQNILSRGGTAKREFAAAPEVLSITMGKQRLRPPGVRGYYLKKQQELYRIPVDGVCFLCARTWKKRICRQKATCANISLFLFEKRHRYRARPNMRANDAADRGVGDLRQIALPDGTAVLYVLL